MGREEPESLDARCGEDVQGEGEQIRPSIPLELRPEWNGQKGVVRIDRGVRLVCIRFQDREVLAPNEVLVERPARWSPAQEEISASPRRVGDRGPVLLRSS